MGIFNKIQAQQPYTLGGYIQLYWDWRPDIADSCYEFTFINYKNADVPGSYCPAINIYYWNDCNYGKSWMNVSYPPFSYSNTPLHDTLFRVGPSQGIRDTFCGYPTVLSELNFAQVMEPLRSRVVYKGFVYLPERCKNWHFAIGRLGDIDLCQNSWSYKNYFVNNKTVPPFLPTPGYSHTLSNIDSLYYSHYYGNIRTWVVASEGFYGCWFNNADFPGNSSPRFLSAPIYSFQKQKAVEYNPGPYDPDHDSIMVTIADTLRGTHTLLASVITFPIYAFIKNDSAGNFYSDIFTENFLYAPLAGQTGPNPLRYNPANPFDTDSTFNLKAPTGQTTFTAKSVMEPILFYKAQEYRNGHLLGETFCANQFTILTDGRLPSYMRIDTASIQGSTAFNNQSTMIGCAGTTISFDAWVKLPGDPNGDLIVRTTADTTVPGNGACTMIGQHTDSVRLHFSWTPPSNAHGLYSVFVTAKDSNCNPPYHQYTQVYTWNFYIDSCTGIIGVNDITTDNSVVLYPNPATNIVTITSSKEFKSIKVFNLLSELVMEKNVKPSKEIALDVSELPSGIYLVNVDGVVRKMVVGD